MATKKYDAYTGKPLADPMKATTEYMINPTPDTSLDISGLVPNSTAGYGAEMNDGGLFGDLTGTDMVDGAGGIVQGGLGLLNYFDNQKVRKAQVRGLNQQVAQSQYGVQRHKDFISSSNNAFRPKG